MFATNDDLGSLVTWTLNPIQTHMLATITSYGEQVYCNYVSIDGHFKASDE